MTLQQFLPHSNFYYYDYYFLFFPQSTEDFKVVFEGVHGGNETGDIALDDINVQQSPCYGLTTTTVPPTTVTSPAYYPLTSIDCDFESIFSNWQQVGAHV
jgi:hypothetical protein